MTNKSGRVIVKVSSRGATHNVDVALELRYVKARLSDMGKPFGQGLPSLTLCKGKPTEQSVKKLEAMSRRVYQESLVFWAEQQRPELIVKIEALCQALDIDTSKRRFDRMKTANLKAEVDKLSKDLEAVYRADIESWNWDDLKASAEPYVDMEGNPKLSQFLGTVFYLCPSGKYYTPFASSNVDDGEALLDEIWYEVLEDVADSHGAYIESGEGDPCDILATWDDESASDASEDDIKEVTE